MIENILREYFFSHRTKINFVILALLLSFYVPPSASVNTKTYNVFDFGAKGDQKTLNTKAIQKTVDVCSNNGGGTIYFPAGTYLSGTIFLKNNVTIYLDNGATLLGSTNINDYPEKTPAFRSYTDVNYVNKSLIYAEKVKNISITGSGTINGQGGNKAFKFPGGREHYKNRPYMIRMIECENIKIKDVTIQNSPMWVQHYLACKDIIIDGITVHSVVNFNNDGIDIDCCENVRISNCDIYSGDDAIVLKSTAPKICKNVTITNCIMSSFCNAFKCGTESSGGFQDIMVSNCVIYDTRLSGIALELVDGGEFNRVMVSNITMNNVKGGIFVRLGNRARPYLATGPGGSIGTFELQEGMNKPPTGSLQNVIISNVIAKGVGDIGCSITGIPNYPIRNITLENIQIEYEGGGSKDLIDKKVPEQEKEYPEYKMFGQLPAYGFYCRHVKNLTFKNLNLSLINEDVRPALLFEDVIDADISDLDAELSKNSPAMIIFKNVNGAFIHSTLVKQQIQTFLKIDNISKNIYISNNDFSNVDQIINNNSIIDKSVILKGNRD